MRGKGTRLGGGHGRLAGGGEARKRPDGAAEGIATVSAATIGGCDDCDGAGRRDGGVAGGGRGVNWPWWRVEIRVRSRVSVALAGSPTTSQSGRESVSCAFRNHHSTALFRRISCMSASIPQAASQTKSLHLLRALLREASYLPDAVARQYFRRYIVSRFKAYQPSQNASTSYDVHALEKYRHRSFKRRQLSIIIERSSKQQKKAQKGLYYLRRANQGEIPCLRKVLFFAYGRIGRRKYSLLDDLLKPDPIKDGDKVLAAPDFAGPSPLQKLYYSNKQWLQYFDAPKPAPNDNYVINISDRYSRLRAVLKSQHQRSISLHRPLKRPFLKTPMHNIWVRPMPIKRAVNNVRRWYAATMTLLLPPIPIEEWDNLHDMVHKKRMVGLVRRRTPVTTTQSATLEHVRDPINIIFDGLRMDTLSKADKPAGILRAHNITPKFMRRLYSKVLQFCCKIEYNTERKHWAVVWGEASQPISPDVYRGPSDASLFAGVDAAGRVVREKVEKVEKVEVERSRDLQPRNSEGEYVRFPFFVEYLPRSNPLRQDLEAWKRKRRAAGLVHEDGTFRGR